MQTKRILFIVNPIAGKGHGARVLPVLKDILFKKGIHSELLVTEKRGDASEMASKFSKDFDIITAVGGDGTISEVVNGFTNTDNTILGIIPCGSGNDFARTIRINESTETDISAILSCRQIKSLDLGQVELTTQDNEIITFRFLNSFGIGFDAVVTKLIKKQKYLKGLPLYLSAVFKTLFIYNSINISAAFDDVIVKGKKLVVAIGNGPTSGGGFKLNPTADPMDGLLDACIIDELSRFRILMELPKAIFGIHTKLPFVKMLKFRIAEIECELPAFVHSDGDLIGENVVKIKLTTGNSKIRVITNM